MTCKHEVIITFRFADHVPALLWCCLQCRTKFAPVDLGRETDAARYRLLRRGQQWSTVNGIGDILRADALDAAIDAARKA